MKLDRLLEVYKEGLVEPDILYNQSQIDNYDFNSEIINTVVLKPKEDVIIPQTFHPAIFIERRYGRDNYFKVTIGGNTAVILIRGTVESFGNSIVIGVTGENNIFMYDNSLYYSESYRDEIHLYKDYNDEVGIWRNSELYYEGLSSRQVKLSMIDRMKDFAKRYKSDRNSVNPYYESLFLRREENVEWW